MKAISFKETLLDIKSDLPGKGILSLFKNYFFHASFRLILNYRLGRYLIDSKLPFSNILLKYLKYKMLTKRNCDISYRAIIGSGVKFPHPLGIVIGDGVVIKKNVKIWQHVTLGSHGKKNVGVSYPTICEDVRVYTGATVIGGVKLGRGAIIGAYSLVNKDIPDFSTAIGVPCEILIRDEK